jgi:hypothetical protein
MNNKKYICETCNFSCEFESIWKQHIETKKHNNDGKVLRENIKKPCDRKCDKCDFIGKHNVALRTHYLTKHGTTEERENEFPYYCKDCDVGSFVKMLLDRHLKSNKHIQKKSAI